MPDESETAFRESYARFEDYPLNLVSAKSEATESTYQRELDEAAPSLFVQGPAEVQVSIRDLVGVNEQVEKRVIFSDEELKIWLEGHSNDNSTKPANLGLVLGKRDPACRFIFISKHGRNPRTPLRITRNMLTRILTYHQVMPSYIEFLPSFGATDQAIAMFSGFRERVSLNQLPFLSIPCLGRSGHTYQLCYNLRRMYSRSIAGGSTSVATGNELHWSIEQAAFYHQFDVETGTAFWLIISPSYEIKTRVEGVTSVRGRIEDRDFSTPERSFKATLAIHLLCAQWSTEECPWYIRTLEELCQRQTAEAAFGRQSLEISQRPEDSLHSLRLLEERTKEVLRIQEMNLEVLRSLQHFYRGLSDNHECGLWGQHNPYLQRDLDGFLSKLNNVMNQIHNRITSARNLHNKIMDHKNQIQDVMQTENEKLTRTMNELGVLTYELGVLSRRDAVAMKIITVVTLIYLPATFVSTFFSTDIVKYQGTDNGSFSNLALSRWLQVTLPLTVITLGFAFAWFRIEARAEAEREKKRKDKSSFAGFHD